MREGKMTDKVSDHTSEISISFSMSKCFFEVFLGEEILNFEWEESFALLRGFFCIMHSKSNNIQHSIFNDQGKRKNGTAASHSVT